MRVFCWLLAPFGAPGHNMALNPGMDPRLFEFTPFGVVEKKCVSLKRMKKPLSPKGTNLNNPGQKLQRN